MKTTPKTAAPEYQKTRPAGIPELRRGLDLDEKTIKHSKGPSVQGGLFLFGLQILNVDSLQGDQEWTAFACMMDTLSKNQILGCNDFNDLRVGRWTAFAAPYTARV